MKVEVRDMGTMEIRSNRAIQMPTRAQSRPWTAAEKRVRAMAEAALTSAKACAALHQSEAAIRCCLYGLHVTTGFPRPFAIRDEIVDFMRRIDPKGTIRKAVVIAALDADTRASD